MRQPIILAFAVCAFILTSCAIPKDITYFQKGNDVTAEQVARMKNYIDPQIKVGDVLTIVVAAENPDAVAPFNLPLVSFMRESGVSSTSSSQQATAGSKELGSSQAMQTYTVDAEGYINFPVIGEFKIAGLKKREAIKALEEKISASVEKPIVNINIINFKITVLGEVNRPGSFTISTDRVSVLDALGYAGDLTIYGCRTNVKLVRDINGVKDIHIFDLTKSDFLVDPYFYLQQNDVVYVEPNDKRKKNSEYSQTDQFRLSVVTAIATVCSVLTSFVVTIVSLSK